MVREIVATEIFRGELQATINYLIKEWTLEIAVEFELTLWTKIETIAAHPEIGQMAEVDFPVRKFNIT